MESTVSFAAALENASFSGNVERIYRMLTDTLGGTLENMYAIKGGRSGKQKKEEPFVEFRHRHEKRPEINLLNHAKRSDNRKEFFKLARRIQSEGWKKYLWSAHPSNLSGTYKYLARADGRKPTRYRYPCSRPLLDGDKLITDHQEKCELLGGSFASKLNDAALPTEHSRAALEAPLHTNVANKNGKGKGSHGQMAKKQLRLPTRKIPEALNIKIPFECIAEMDTSKAV